MKSVKDIVENILSEFLSKNNIELYDVTFEKQGSDRFLRVFIDKEGPVSINDCEMVSRFLSNKLDKNDPIEEAYFLEVSSPGAERELKKDSDFIKFKGSKVRLKLKRANEGQKVITGKLVGKENDLVIVKDDCLEDNLEISLDNIKSIKNVLEF